MKIEIENLTGQIALAAKKPAVKMDELTKVFDELGGQLIGYLKSQGAEIVCAPYCKYSGGNADYTQFDIEFGFPVNKPLPEKDGFFMSKTYEGKAVTTTYKGSYKGLDAAYVAIVDYLKENSLEHTDDCYDYYLNNPDENPEDELLTKVIFPIK